MKRKYLMPILAIVFGLMSIIMSSQEINIVKEGYFIMYDANGIKFDQKLTEAEAIQGLYNYQISTGKIGTYVAPTMRIDISGLKPPTISDTIYIPGEVIYEAKPSEIDTIQVELCWDLLGKKVWYHGGDINMYPHPIYFPTKEKGMIRVEFKDTLTIPQKIYQTKWKLERLKDFENARTLYSTIKEVPFQFYIDDSIISIDDTTLKVRVFGSEDWYPQFIVNGIEREPLYTSTPGSPEINGMTMRRHSCTIDGLEPNTQYDIQVKGYCRRDESETDIATFTITTK